MSGGRHIVGLVMQPRSTGELRLDRYRRCPPHRKPASVRGRGRTGNRRCHTDCDISRLRYALGVGDRWHVILSAEVTRWYEALPIRELAQADQALDRLAAEGIELAVPHNRYLSDKLWELRFRCGQVNQRITYTADPDRKIVTLTTFRKQRDNERAEIRRARNALRKHQQKKGRPP